MEKLQIKDRWPEVKNKVQKAYAHLTEDDLKYVEGREDEFINRLQEKTGKQRDELVKWINRL